MSGGEAGDPGSDDGDVGHGPIEAGAQPNAAPPRLMAMTKRVAVVGGIAILAAVTVACGAGSGGGGSEAAGGGTTAERVPATDTAGGTAGGTGTTGGLGAVSAQVPAPPGDNRVQPAHGAVRYSGPKSAPDAVSALTGRDLVQKAYITVRVDDVGKAATRVHSVAARYDGFVSDEAVDTDPKHPSNDSGTITIRVPQSSYDTALAAIAGVGTQTSLQRSVEDVTEQTIDVASRVRTQRASIDRIRALLSNATELGQVIALESELTKRQADLESLEHQLHALRNQVALATITTDLVSAAAATTHHDNGTHGFVDGLQAGWDAFVNAATAIATAIGAALPFVVLLGVVIAGVVALRRRYRRPPPPEFSA
jgi:hypothetical protein